MKKQKKRIIQQRRTNRHGVPMRERRSLRAETTTIKAARPSIFR